jgi:HAD superfamily hydrolase (TIGR01549 family)
MVIVPGVEFIYFDFDNVLATRTENRATLLAQLLRLPDAAVLRQFYMHGFREDPVLLEAYRSIRSVDEEVAFYAAAFTQFAARTNALVAIDTLHEAAKKFVGIPFVTDNMAAVALEQLAKRYHLGILTNGLPSRHQDIEQSGLRNYFDKIVVSSDYGIEKPAQALYDKAAEATGFSIKELALVDDEPLNVRGAEQAGFGMAIAFTPAFWQQVMQS